MKKNFFLTLLAIMTLLLGVFTSCRGDDDELTPPNGTDVTEGQMGDVKGFFLLNEANMGSNLASIDYFNYESGTYYENIYPTLNPTIKQELGDVGNDIKIYDNKLFAVINVSGYVEVMDAKTGKHLNQILVQNCRYITFKNGYAYISSYNGPVLIDPKAPLGCVVKINLSTMQEVGRCTVGYQPEEMVIRDNKLYVANSGGYRVPEYDNTVSVIDLATFEEEKKITVGINLHRMELDRDNNIYISSRGDYKQIKAKTYIIDKNNNISKALDLPCSNMTICGDSLYVYSSEWSHLTNGYTFTYGIVNTKTQQIVSRNFITDGTEKQIQMPYGLAVNPSTREIYVTDAKDFTSSGVLYCFTPQGKRKWAVVTGEIPAHIVFTDKKLETINILQNK